jgi:hypothetical protein
VLTDAERAEALARFQARLDALPPPTEDRVARIAALFASILLRRARDRARADISVGEPDTSRPVKITGHRVMPPVKRAFRVANSTTSDERRAAGS